MGFYQCHTANFVLLEKRETGNFPAHPSVYLQQKKSVHHNSGPISRGASGKHAWPGNGGWLLCVMLTYN